MQKGGSLYRVHKEVAAPKPPFARHSHPTKSVLAGTLKRCDRTAGVVTSMGKEWITDLAQEIQQKGHETAENYGRSQHLSEVITKEGKPFFTAFVISLEDDVNQIKRQLQGDVTSCDTNFQTVTPTEVKLTRSRFPWFDARITHQDPIIILDYAKSLGVTGDPALDREVCHFDFRIAANDTLYVQESFGENPRQFNQPEELARHIVELLFSM
jgi:hypothetical protein